MKPLRNPDRFWSKVDVRGPDECWPWTSVILDDGYGAIWHDGNNKRAHRVAYFLTHGELPDDLMVMHSCDNPACVNPAHLSLGTNTDNMADRSAKGRAPHGEGHPRAKLTERDVLAILADQRPGRDVAAIFGINRSVVGGIRRGELWKHVPRPPRPDHQAGAIRASGGRK